jgi:emfourin
MRIKFERSGGFAGLTITRDFDLDALPGETGKMLSKMIDDANFFNLPAKLASRGAGADQFNYAITVTSGIKEHTVSFNEGDMPDSLRPLIDELTQLARQQPK